MITSLTTRLPWLAWLLIALPVMLFAGIALFFAENIPWFDDVEMFIGFIQEYYNVNSLNEKAFWLLKPNNEHRILFAKLAALFTYVISGHMNFRGMILIGNLFTLLTVGLLYLVFRSLRLSIWAFVPVPFVLLHPQYFMTISWSITSLQHPVVLFLICLVMYLLSRSERTRFLWAIPVQVFASLSMSNALFGWVAGGVILWRQKHYRRLAIWSVMSVLTIVVYLNGFTQSQSQGSSKTVAYLTHNPHMAVVGLVSFLGGSFDFFPTLPTFWRGILPALGGTLLLLTCLWLVSQMDWSFRRRMTLTNKRSVPTLNANFFLGCYIVLLINAAAVGLLRIMNGFTVMLVSNYMIYPALLISLVYINGLQVLPVRRQTHWRRLGMTLGVLIWGLAYFWHLPEMAFRHRYVQTAAYNQEHNGIGLGATIGTEFENYMQDTLSGAVKRGYYRYPASPIAGYSPSSDTLGTVVQRRNDAYYFESTYLTTPVQGAYAVLASDTRTYLAPAKNPYRLASFWLRRPTPVLQAELRADDIRPGTYRLGWATESAAGKRIQFSSQQLVVQ